MVKVIMDVQKKEFSFEELVEIIRILRAPGGCPWDAEQTHKSIRNEFVEETYEAVDAIDRSNPADLCEELGDVLLQILLHAQISREENEFTIDDVINGLANKMILRHPHVFGEVKVESTDEVLKNWDAIKKTEKNQTSAADTLYCVPKAYPALMRAAKVQKRAGKAGVKLKNGSALANDIVALADKLKQNTEEGNKQEIAQTLADLYFSTCALALSQKIDSEEILGKKTDSFIKEFDELEKSGKSVENLLL